MTLLKTSDIETAASIPSTDSEISTACPFWRRVC